MRTLRRTLFVLMVLLLPLTMGAAAFGSGAEAMGKPSTTTTTTQAALGGRNCAESGYDENSHGLVFTETGFAFTLSNDTMCIDVLHGTAGVWTVTVTDYAGRINRLLMVPRDSYAPGDSCGGADLRQPDLAQPIELPLPADPRHEPGIPAATVNACGTRFGELIDGMLVTTPTGEPHPLAFVATLEGTKGAYATINVTLP